MKKAMVFFVLLGVFTLSNTFAANNFSSDYEPTVKDETLLNQVEAKIGELSSVDLLMLEARIENILSKLDRHSRLEYLIYELYEDVQVSLYGEADIANPDNEVSDFIATIEETTDEESDMKDDEDDESHEEEDSDENEDYEDENEEDEYIDVNDIPQKAIDYIESNYPWATIMEAEMEDDGIEVELDNGTELEFTLDGTFIKAEIEDEEDDDEEDDEEDDDEEDDD